MDGIELELIRRGSGRIHYEYAYWLAFEAENLSLRNIEAFIKSAIDDIESIADARSSRESSGNVVSTVIAVRRDLSSLLESANLSMAEDERLRLIGDTLLSAVISISSCPDFVSKLVDPTEVKLERVVTDLCYSLKAVYSKKSGRKASPPGSGTVLPPDASETLHNIPQLSAVWALVNCLLSLGESLQTWDKNIPIERVAMNIATLLGLWYETDDDKKGRLSPATEAVISAAQRLLTTVKLEVLLKSTQRLTTRLEEGLEHAEYMCKVTKLVVSHMSNVSTEPCIFKQRDLTKFWLLDIRYTLHTLCHLIVRTYGDLPGDWGKCVMKTLQHLEKVEEILMAAETEHSRLLQCSREAAKNAIKEFAMLEKVICNGSRIPLLLEFMVLRASSLCFGTNDKNCLNNTKTSCLSRRVPLSAAPIEAGNIAKVDKNHHHRYVRSLLYDVNSLSIYHVAVTIHDVKTELQRVVYSGTTLPGIQDIDSVIPSLYHLLRHALKHGNNSDLIHMGNVLTQVVLTLSGCILEDTISTTESACVIARLVTDLCSTLRGVQHKLSSTASGAIVPSVCGHDASLNVLHRMLKVADTLLIMAASQSDTCTRSRLQNHAVVSAALSGILTNVHNSQQRVAVADMLTKEVLCLRKIVDTMYSSALPAGTEHIANNIIDKEFAYCVLYNALAALNPVEHSSCPGTHISTAVKDCIVSALSNVRTTGEFLKDVPTESMKEQQKYWRSTAAIEKMLCEFYVTLGRISNVTYGNAIKDLMKTAQAICEKIRKLEKDAKKHKAFYGDFYYKISSADAEISQFLRLVTIGVRNYDDKGYVLVDPAYCRDGEIRIMKPFLNKYKKLLKNCKIYGTDVRNLDTTHMYVDNLMRHKPHMETTAILDTVDHAVIELRKINSSCGTTASTTLGTQVINSVSSSLDDLVKSGAVLGLDLLERKLTEAVFDLVGCITHGSSYTADASCIVQQVIVILCTCLRATHARTSQQLKSQSFVDVHYATSELPSDNAKRCRHAVIVMSHTMLFMANQGKIKESKMLRRHAVVSAALASVLSDGQSPQHRKTVEDALIKEVVSIRNIAAQIDNDALSTETCSIVDKELAHHVLELALVALNPATYGALEPVRYTYAIRVSLVEVLGAVCAILELAEATPNLVTNNLRVLPKYVKSADEIKKRLCAFALALNSVPRDPGAKDRKQIAKTAEDIYRSVIKFAKECARSTHITQQFVDLAEDASIKCGLFHNISSSIDTGFEATIRLSYAPQHRQTLVGSAVHSREKLAQKSPAEKHKKEIDVVSVGIDITDVSATHSYIDSLILSTPNLSAKAIERVACTVKMELQKVVSSHQEAVDTISKVVLSGNSADPSRTKLNILDALASLLTVKEEVRRLCVRGDTDLLGACIVNLGNCAKALQVPLPRRRKAATTGNMKVGVVDVHYGDTFSAVSHAILALTGVFKRELPFNSVQASLKEAAVIIAIIAGILDSCDNSSRHQLLAELALSYVQCARDTVSGIALTESEHSTCSDSIKLVTFMCDFVITVFGARQDLCYTLVHFSDFVRFNLLHVKYLTESVREALSDVGAPLRDILKQHVIDILDQLCVMEAALNDEEPLTDTGLERAQNAATYALQRLQNLEKELSKCKGVPQIITYYLHRAMEACKACNSVPLPVSADPGMTPEDGATLRKMQVSKSTMGAVFSSVDTASRAYAVPTKLLLYRDVDAQCGATDAHGETPRGSATNTVEHGTEKYGRLLIPSSHVDSASLTRNLHGGGLTL